uniref:Uncharacterized protein n=1 Tax=Heterorhabditis bacteriophora TaxID=37862 RepID=A0A1I7XBT6_HETBA
MLLYKENNQSRSVVKPNLSVYNTPLKRKIL